MRWTMKNNKPKHAPDLLACNSYVDSASTETDELQYFPMPDVAHVQAAISFLRYAPEGEKPDLARTILEKAKELNIVIRNPLVLEWASK